MARIAALAVAMLACAACAGPLRPELAYTVPETHVFQKALLGATGDAVQVDLIQYFPYGRGYTMRIWVDSVAIADVSNREKLSIYLPPGHHLFAVGDMKKPGKQWAVEVAPARPVVLVAREAAGGLAGTKLERLP